MSLAGWLVYEGSRLCHPVVLQVPPVTPHRVTTNSTNVVVSAQHRAGATLQNDAESPGRNVEVAGLEPDTVCIRNPAATFIQVDIGNEMFAASSIWIEAVGETVEGSNGQRCTLTSGSVGAWISREITTHQRPSSAAVPTGSWRWPPWE